MHPIDHEGAVTMEKQPIQADGDDRKGMPDGVSDAPAKRDRKGESQGGAYPNPHTGKSDPGFDGGQSGQGYHGAPTRTLRQKTECQSDQRPPSSPGVRRIFEHNSGRSSVARRIRFSRCVAGARARFDPFRPLGKLNPSLGCPHMDKSSFRKRLLLRQSQAFSRARNVESGAAARAGFASRPLSRRSHPLLLASRATNRAVPAAATTCGKSPAE
jgi:hypothetical protein